jgi:hypothetical protein
LVICSLSVLGYLRQLTGLILYIAHFGIPSSSYLSAGQIFGNLQHSPHLTHFPVLWRLTGNIAVKVRKIRENQLFFIAMIQVSKYFLVKKDTEFQPSFLGLIQIFEAD